MKLLPVIWAAKVLAEKLAACVTLLPAPPPFITGKVLEQEYEVQMLLKTNLTNQQALPDCLKSHHPYQTPDKLVGQWSTAIMIILMAQRFITLILLCSTPLLPGCLTHRPF